MNFDTNITAQESLKCSAEEALAIFKTLDDSASFAINKADPTVVSVTHEESRMAAEYYPKSNDLYFFAEETADDSQIPDDFIIAVGKLLAKLKKPHLEFGVAHTADKHAPGSYGGSSFRITSKGTLIYPKITWPRG
jgi:hypothetical protein